MTKFFVRKSSSPEAASELITEFLDYLWSLEAIFDKSIPKEIHEAIATLNEKITVSKFSKLQTKEKQILSYLKQYLHFPCFGFNSGKHLLWSIYHA